MSTPHNTTQIPNQLWEYLATRLKVMATIADEAGEEQWGIFFGNAWTNDLDYPGKVQTIARQSWNTKGPICLLPLTELARNLAFASISENRKPEIKCSAIKLCNSGKTDVDGNHHIDWDDYHFWYKNEHSAAWDVDTNLFLVPNTLLKSLHPKGAWRQYSTDAQNFWPIWTNIEKSDNSDDVTKKSDRLIVFPAPVCEIVSPEGQYLVHEIWFGSRVANKSIYSRPFIGIDEATPDNVKDGKDCPVVWHNSYRFDDILSPQKGNLLTSENWLDVIPFNRLIDGQGKRSKEVYENFRGDDESTLRSWCIAESDDKTKQRFLRIIYSRSYYSDGKLADILGGWQLDNDPQVEANIVSMVQVCRGSENHLLLRIACIASAYSDNLLNVWNDKTSIIEKGLLYTESAMPIGIVPKIERTVPIGIAFSVSEWTWHQNNLCQAGQTTSFSLTSNYFVSGGKQISLKADRIRLPLLKTERGQNKKGKEIDLTVLKPEFEACKIPSVQDNGTFFRMKLTAFSAIALADHNNPILGKSDGIKLHDGSLSMKLCEASSQGIMLGQAGFGIFRMALQLKISQQPFFLWQWFKDIDNQDKIVVSYAIEDFSLPILSVYPAGQDLLIKDRLVAPSSIGAVVEGVGERNEPALIIPLSAPDSDSESVKYLLTFNESVNVGQNHRLDVKLQEYNPTAGQDTSSTMTAVVLDANPQFISLIQARFLQQPGYDDGAWVLARRSFLNEEGGWEMLDDQAGTEGFVMALPAQAIGEAYVKGRRPEPGAPDPTENPEPGEPVIPDINKPVDKQYIQYRFGQPTLLRISPERLERRYVAAPWNVRRILANTGSAAPGVPLREAQWELLYGLQGHMTPEKAFIAELATKLGEVPVPPVNNIAWQPTKKQQEAFADAWQQYLRFYRAWQSRLAILEPMVDEDFGKGVFDKNISYNLRIKLKDQEIPDPEHPNRTKPALNGKFDRIGAELRNPVDPEQNSDQQEEVINPTADPNTVYENKLRAIHDKNGLAGGAVYGFESKAIYRELLREVLAGGSSSGELKEPAFSSLGGYGMQTARFAGNKTVIKSTTAMGRTHFYAVERIGRIGVFWHRAKHVIEYERTVVPSAQFATYQPPHYGRPLLRKVREYIEILEPTRSYPDYKDHPQDAPGSVTGCTFKSKIIPVLSAWGRDVTFGKKTVKNAAGADEEVPNVIGWELPLWNRGADLAIYPKPQVHLSLLPPLDSDEKQVVVLLSEPQNLYFYTDVRPTVIGENSAIILITAETNAWPAVRYVDYAPLPRPRPYDIAPAREGSEAIDAPMPDVPPIQPGFERFTFLVDRAEVPASVAGRYFSNSGISGRLCSASMMRAAPEKDETPDKWAQDEQRRAICALLYGSTSLLAKTANGFQQPDTLLLNGEIPTIEKYHQPLIDAFAGVPDKLKHLLKDPLSQQFVSAYFNHLRVLGEAFHSRATQWLWRQALEGADGAINRSLSLYDHLASDTVERVITVLEQPANTVEKVASTLDGLWEQVDVFRIEFSFSTAQAFTSLQQVIDQLSEELTEGMNEYILRLDKAIIALLPEVETDQLRTQTTAAVEAFDAAAEKLTTKIFVPLKKIHLSNKIHPPMEELEGRLNAAKDAIKHIIEIANGEFGSSLEFIQEVKAALHSAMTDFNQTVRETTSQLHMQAKNALANLEQDVNGLNAAAEKVWTDIHNLVHQVIEEVKAELQKSNVVVLDAVRSGIGTIRKQLEDILVAFFSKALKADDPATSLYKVLMELDSIFKSIEDVVRASLLQFFGDKVDEDKIKEWLAGYDTYERLKQALDRRDKTAILRESVALANTVNRDLGRLVGEAAQVVQDADRVVASGTEVIQAGQQTLTNFRSVWEEFTAPGMGLNRRTVALLVRTDYKEVAQRLSLTPAITRLKQFGNDLEGLGLRLPVVAITDQLLAAKKEWGEYAKSQLGNFNFSDLLSDIGGMRLDKLFPSFKMPEYARDKIKITQGFDKEQLRAWANAEIDLKLDETQTLLSIGPLRIDLQEGLFRGKVQLQVDIDGKVKKANSGELRGSFVIGVSGTPIMIFKEAGVVFRDDKLSFDLDPKRMEMPGLLSMLTDASKTISDIGIAGADADGNKIEAFKVGILKVGEIPVGVRAELNLPPVTVSGGVSGISNLSFGGHFLLSVLDEKLDFQFLLGLGFYLGKKEAPFNIIIFILGGGGYVDCALTFSPKCGLAVDFSMSVLASASVAFSTGWAQGFVLIAVGFEMEYHKPAGGQGNAYISIYVLMIGQMDILSLVTIYVSLLLQATYRAIGGGVNELVGTGRIRASIRVCRFLTIKVDKSFQKRLAQG